MFTTTRDIAAPPEDVWAVLADGWTYPLWVVGASRMREVDEEWPAVGARLHHSVGTWPLLFDDYTEVLDVAPGASITLRARFWPAGEALVRLELEPKGTQTRVLMHEDVKSGPGKLVPAPVRGPGMKWRNTESLKRLAYVAENKV